MKALTKKQKADIYAKLIDLDSLPMPCGAVNFVRDKPLEKKK